MHPTGSGGLAALLGRFEQRAVSDRIYKGTLHNRARNPWAAPEEQCNQESREMRMLNVKNALCGAAGIPYAVILLAYGNAFARVMTKHRFGVDKPRKGHLERNEIGLTNHK